MNVKTEPIFMKFQYNYSDRSSNIFTKFDKNPTQSKRDISRKSGTDRQTQTHKHTDKVCRIQQATDTGDNNSV